VLFVGVGAVAKLDLVWSLSDTFNGLMAIPNLISMSKVSRTKSKVQNLILCVLCALCGMSINYPVICHRIYEIMHLDHVPGQKSPNAFLYFPFGQSL
jgi:hypothetical protein